MSDEKQEKGFKVVDRRSFDTEGEEREASAQTEPMSEPAQPREPSEAEGDLDYDENGDPGPEIDFVTFVLSLYHSAECHLGLSLNPETKTCDENLPLAKETIDILGMLQDKTQGNLTGEEERILSEVLFNLRMSFVKVRRG